MANDDASRSKVKNVAASGFNHAPKTEVETSANIGTTGAAQILATSFKCTRIQNSVVSIAQMWNISVLDAAELNDNVQREQTVNGPSHNPEQCCTEI
jgi:hypothetical protein